MIKNTKELVAAKQALDQGSFDVAISEAEPFLDSENVDVNLEAHTLIGLANFRKSNYEEAQKHFQIIIRSSHSVGDWFNLLTSSVLAGDFDTAEKAFRSTAEHRKTTTDPEEISIPFIMFYYACALRDKKQWETALEQIGELRKIYEELHITDDTFVYLRGVPFLSHTLQVALDVFRGLGNKFNADKWLNSFAKKLDSEGKELIQEYRHRLKADA